VLDIEGNQREIVDAKDRVVMRYDYDILSHRIHQASMEAGERWTLSDVAGKPIFSWDSREHILRTTYDALRRPLDSFLREGTGEEKQIGRTVYGEELPHPEPNNLRGKAHQAFDTASLATSERYDFKGNLLAARRQILADYKQAPDWSTSPALEAETYASSTVYDALNRPIQVVAPHAMGSQTAVVQPTYNEAALLEKLDVWPRFDGEPQALLDGGTADLHAVTNLDYNAKGQRVLIEYGNGVRTDYDYDPLTFRLRRLRTRRGRHALQDLGYTYDPAGNITHLRDGAQETIFFRNRAVEPSADYAYDALYRLIAATGREHLGQPGGAPEPTSPTDAPRVGLPHPGDGAAMGRYRERYEYDEVGNFLRLIHHGEPHASGGWTRSYRYEEASQIEPSQVSNRLTSTQTGHHAAESYTYDADGNTTAMPHLSLMQWDFRDQLQAVARQAAGEDETQERTYYVYDAAGQRVRKVTERAKRSRERLYLGGFEIYREFEGDGTTVHLERATLHVMDDKQRVALIETRTQGSDPAPAHLVRYQLGNHLGSATLELDAGSRVISYEEYYPYGSTSYQAVRSRTETPKRYRYTGKERDEESGFYYHGARYYAPWLGRWVSSDPIGTGDGPNTFQYSRANPIVVSDPTGTEGEGVVTIPEVTIVGDAREAKAEGHVSSWLESHGLSATSPEDLALSLGLGPVNMQYLEGYLQAHGLFQTAPTPPPEPYKGPSVGPSNLSDDDFREMSRARDAAERRQNHPNAYDIMVSDAQIVSHAVDPSGMGIIKGPATVVMTAAGVDPEKAQQIATVLDMGAGLMAMASPHGSAGAPVEEMQTNSLVLGAEADTAAGPLARMSDRAIAQSHLNYVNAVNTINAAEALGPDFQSWMAENQGWMVRGNAMQSMLADSLANNPVTSQMWVGIDQPPGVSVPDLLHTGSGNARPFGDVFPLNERQIAAHSDRWYSPYSDFFMYTQPPRGWNPPPPLQQFMQRTK
ncbi:MAG TPA: RHS repeat-associated core domain-containing protein, partial [Thermoanaerobaculia bacterium]